MRVGLALAIAVWTLVAWGGRIGLLTSDEGWGAWLRIGGSIVVGLGAAAVLLVPQLARLRRPVLVVFSVFSVLLWARSLFVTWTGDGSMPFKLVHTVLALGFFALAVWAWRVASGGRDSEDHPDLTGSGDHRINPRV